MRYKRMLAMLLSFALILGNSTSTLADNNTADPGAAGTDVVQDDTGDEGGEGNADGAGIDDPSDEGGNKDGSDVRGGESGGATDGADNSDPDAGNGGDDGGSGKASDTASENEVIEEVISENETVSRNRMESGWVDNPMYLQIRVNNDPENKGSVSYNSEELFRGYVDELLKNDNNKKIIIKPTDADGGNEFDSWDIEGAEILDFADKYDRVTLDLNGKILRLTSDEARLYAKRITNGTIEIKAGGKVHISSLSRNSSDEELAANPVSEIMLDHLEVMEAAGNSTPRNTFLFFDGECGERIRIGENIKQSDSDDEVKLSNVALVDRYSSDELEVNGKTVEIENNLIEVADKLSLGDGLSMGKKGEDYPSKINLLQKSRTVPDAMGNKVDRASLIFDQHGYGTYIGMYDDETGWDKNDNPIEFNVYETAGNKKELADFRVPDPITSGIIYRYTGKNKAEIIDSPDGVFVLPDKYTNEFYLYFILDAGSSSRGTIGVAKYPQYTEVQLISAKAVSGNVVSGNVVSENVVAAYSEENPIKLHVGEYDHIGLRFISKTGNEEDNRDVWNVNELADILGAPKERVSLELQHSYALFRKNGAGYAPVDFGTPVDRDTDAWASKDGVSIHIKGTSTASANEYYLRLRTNPLWEGMYTGAEATDVILEGADLYIPVIVEESEPGVEYPEPSEGAFCKTRQEAYQAVRDIITQRIDNSSFYGFSQTSSRAREMNGGKTYNNYVYDRIYVRRELFNGNQIMMEDVCDFNYERAGMKPNEGDYIMHCIGDSVDPVYHWMDPKTIGNETIYGSDGERYDVYEVYLPMMTTKAQEKWVDEKVAGLMKTTFAGVKNGSNAQKIRAIYDYITENVSGSVPGQDSDYNVRRKPIYHTAYCALYNHYGTCESFAMLFSRLSRELGVPSKVIMGVDANNHTYNIVENDDGYWYLIDTNTKRYLSAANEFERTQEQSKFRTQEFINSYWSKLKNGSYQYKSIYMTVIPSDGSSMYSGNYDAVTSYIVDHLRSDPDGDTHYTIRLDGNVTIKWGQLVDFGRYMDRVSFDLNGKTLKFETSTNIFAGEFKNGTLAIDDGTIRVGSDYDNLFGSTRNAKNKYDKRGDMKLTNIKFTTPKRNGGRVEFDGYSHVRMVLDNVSITNMNCWGYCCTEFPESEYERCYIFDLQGKFSLTNGRFSLHPLYGEEPAMRILRTVDTQGNKIAQGSLSFTNSEIGFQDYYGNDCPLYIVPVNVDTDGKTVSGNTISGNTISGNFADGDLIANVSGTLKNSISNRTVTADEMTEFVENTISVNSIYLPEGCAPVFEDGTLMVLNQDPAVVVSYMKDGSLSSNEYTSFKRAVTNGIKEERGTEYELKLLKDVYLTSDTTIPSYVSKLTLTTSENTVAGLDFNGRSLTYAGTGEIATAGGFTMKSSDGLGNLKLTPAKGKNATLTLSANDIASTVSGEYISYVSNVNITAGGTGTGNVVMKGLSENEAPVAEIFGGSVNATKLTVEDGSFDTTNVSVTDLEVKKGSFGTDTLTATGNVNVGQDAGMTVHDTLTMKSGLFTNEGRVTADTVSTILKLDNKPGAYFNAQKYNMVSTGGLYLEPGSKFHVGRSATIYNLYLGQDSAGSRVDEKDVSGNQLPADLTRGEDAAITINTKVQAKDPNKDRLAVTSVSVDDITPVGTEKQTKLFTTNIKTFPLELVELIQPAGSGYEKYTQIVQIDNAIVVGTDWISIYVGRSDKPINTFMKWSDAMTYLNTICQTGVDYRIVLSEDVQTRETLTFPSKVKSVCIVGDKSVSGNGDSEPVRLSYLGNINLATDMYFQNLILEPQTYDKKNDTYSANDASTINLNGKEFIWQNTYSKNKFASVNGGGASTFELYSWKDKLTFTATKGITVPNLTVHRFRLVSETDGLTASNEAYLSSADIDVRTNLSFRNLHTLDPYNTLSYGAAANNTLKVNGTIDTVNSIGIDMARPYYIEEDVKVRGRDNEIGELKSDISAHALGIQVKYIENAVVHDISGNPISDPANKGKNYVLTDYTLKNGKWTKGVDYTTKDLVISAKIPASYFVIGKNATNHGGGEYDAHIDDVQFILKKVGNAMRVEPAESFNVTLYRTSDDIGHDKEIVGYYATLQDAFTDIDRYALKDSYYTMETDHTKQQEITNRVNLTMPKQAQKITITTKGVTLSSNRADYTVLYMNNAMNLNCNVVLDRVVIADYRVVGRNGPSNTKLNIGLGGWQLKLKDVYVGGDDPEWTGYDRIGNITGSGVSKGSVFAIKNSALVSPLIVTGNLTNIEYVDLYNAVLKVRGGINIGNVGVPEYYGRGRLIGTVKSMTDTAIVPNITVANHIDWYGFGIGLMKKDGTNLKRSDVSGNEVLNNGKFSIAAAPHASSWNQSYMWAESDSEDDLFAKKADGLICKKDGNLVYYADMDQYDTAFTLGYLEDENDTYGYSYTQSFFMSFADAVAEINRQGVKRHYTVYVDGPDSMSTVNPSNPAMPQAKNISSLIIQGSGDYPVFYYTGNTITLTCPTEFYNITLSRAVKDGDGYVSENKIREYLAATTLKTAGYDLTYMGDVVWDTPLVTDGGKKGSLVIEDGATVITNIDKGETPSGNFASGAYINGSVTNFDTIKLGEKQELILRGFKTGTLNKTTGLYKETYVAPTLTATAIDLNGGRIDVGDEKGELNGVLENYPIKYPANMTVTYLTVSGCEARDVKAVNVHGKLTATNLTLKESAGRTTLIAADRDFSIANKGTLVSGTPSANLITRRNSKGVPYLTIPGTVELQDKADTIGVTVKKSIEDIAAGGADGIVVLPEVLPEGETPTDASRQLLAAAGARADAFTVWNDGTGPDENVFLMRNEKAKTVQVYKKTEMKVTLVPDAAGCKTVSSGAAEILYYPSWADAVTAINSMNNGSMYYSAFLNDAVGINYDTKIPTGAAFVMPAKGKAKGLYITADEAATLSGNNYAYYTGTITLTCPTELNGIDLNPIASVNSKARAGSIIYTLVKGAKANISAGEYDLMLKDVTVGNEFNKISDDAPAAGEVRRPVDNASGGVSQIGNVSSTSGVISMASPDLPISGDLTSSKGTINIIKDLTVAQKVTAPNLVIDENKKLTAGANGVTVTTLTMNGNAVLRDTVPTGKITITDIVNGGSTTSSANKIEYGRNAKYATNLEIKGILQNAQSSSEYRSLVLDMVSANEAPITASDAYALSLNSAMAYKDGLISNPKITLDEKKKLFIAPKLKSAQWDSTMFGGAVQACIGGTSLVGCEKCNNAFWLVKSDDGDYNSSTKVKAQIVKAPGALSIIDTDAQYQGDEIKGKATIVNNRINLQLLTATEKQPETFVGAYLDWNQAIAEINALDDPEAEYRIETNTGIYDTNLTDSNWRSALTMPGNNKAKALYIYGSGTSARFSGVITTYGHVEMNDVILNSQNNKGDAPADFNITMNPNSKGQAGAPGLFLTNVITMADKTSWNAERSFVGTEIANRTGFIGKISGSRSKTENVLISGNDIRVKSGIANVNELTLTDAQVISVAGTTANVLNMESTGTVSSNLTALAASTVGTVTTDSKSFIGTMGQANTKAAFTISGTLGNTSRVKIKPVQSVAQAGDKYNVITFFPGDKQKDIRLVTAPKTDAQCFVAADLPGGDIIAYKDISNIVYNGRISDMDVKLERFTAGTDGYPSGAAKATGYAKSYKDAISMINAAADASSAYKITFLKTGPLTTCVNAAPSTVSEEDMAYSFGALTWPKANTAKSLIIAGSGSGSDVSKMSQLRYTGTLKPNAANLKVRFENIVLTEGTVQNEKHTRHNKDAGKKDVTYNYPVFKPSYAITPDLSGANGVEISFWTGANTLKTTTNNSESLSYPLWIDASKDERAVLGLGESMTISGNKSKILVFSKVASSTRYPDNRLGFSGHSVLLRASSTIPSLEIPDGKVTSIYTVTPLTINGKVTGGSHINISTAFTDYVAPAAGKPFTGWGNTQLTLNGDILTKIIVSPYVDNNGAKYGDRNAANKDHEYKGINDDQLNALDVANIGSYQPYAKIANVKKGNADKFIVWSVKTTYTWDSNSLRVRKNNGALYMNSADPKVRVTRTTSDGKTMKSELDNWAMAVAEINNTADKTSDYVIELMDNDGGLGGFNNKFNPNGLVAQTMKINGVDCSTDVFVNAPLSKLDMPSQAKHITIKSENSEKNYLITTASKITFNCDTEMHDMGIIRVASQKNDLYNYKAGGNYDLAVGGWTVNISDMLNDLICHGDCKDKPDKKIDFAVESNIGNITGNKNGKLNFILAESDSDEIMQIGAVTGVGELKFKGDSTKDQNVVANGRLAPVKLSVDGTRGWVDLYTKADLSVTNLNTVSGNISTGKAITVTNLDSSDSMLFAGDADGANDPGEWGSDNSPATADLTVTNAVIRDMSSLWGQNVTAKTDITMDNSFVIAGRYITKAGQGGKVTLAKVHLLGKNQIEVKQDKNGKSQLNISGTMDSTDPENSMIYVGVYYNDYSGFAQIYNGIALATVPKTEASWFRPMVDDSSSHFMGIWPEDYSVYKSGNTVCFGDVSDFEVSLVSRNHDSDATAQSEFATFEEAVKEIGALNRRYQRPGSKTWYYEDYDIVLHRDVEITNAKGTYIAPSLPSAVGTLLIYTELSLNHDGTVDKTDTEVAAIIYSGALNIKSNTVMGDLFLADMGVNTGAKPGNLSIGNYEVTFEDVHRLNCDLRDIQNYKTGKITKHESTQGKPLEFGAITGGANGMLFIGELDGDENGAYKYSHDKDDPYLIEAASVGSIRGVDITDNTELDVTGAYSAGRIIFETLSDNVVGVSGNTASLRVDGNLTTQQIQKRSDIDARLYVNSTKTNKINGIQNKSTKQFITFTDSYDETTNEFREDVQSDTEGAVSIYVTDSDKVGTKVMTVRDLGTSFNVFSLYDRNVKKRNKYRSGDNLMLGNAV